MQDDSRLREFFPRLVDLFVAGRMPLDRLVTRHKREDVNGAAAYASAGATIKPVLLMPA